MANFLSSLIPILSGVAGVVPGVGTGVKAGLLGLNSLIGGADAARKARNATSKMEDGYGSILQNGQDQSALAQKYLAPMLQRYSDTITNGSIPQYDARFRGYAEGKAPEYDNAVAQSMMDFGSRGFGLGSSPVAGSVSHIRGDQAHQQNLFRQNLMTEDMTNRNNMLQSLVPMLSGMNNQGVSQQSGALNGMGGLGGMFQSQADGYTGDLTTLGGMLPGILGNNKNPNAGNNRLGTNQVADPNGNQVSSHDGRIDTVPMLGNQSQSKNRSLSIPRLNTPRLRF